MKIVPGPDFPTGGIIIGRSGIRQAFETGRESITIRARTEFEEIRKDRQAIIVTEIPYQVNKKSLIERIAELVRGKQIEGIGEMRDESDRSGMRIVMELKRDATPEVVLNQLFRFTQLQTSFGINVLALDDGQPRQMGLRDALLCFIRFREEVIVRRSRFELGKRARPGAQPGGAGDRGRQYRRGDPADPCQPRCGGGAGGADGPGLAGRGYRRPAGVDRRAGQCHRRRRHGAADRGAGARHPGIAAATPDRAGAREDPGRDDRGGGEDPRAAGHLELAYPAHGGDDARN